MENENGVYEDGECEVGTSGDKNAKAAPIVGGRGLQCPPLALTRVTAYT
jgi:hypothetical protein